MDTDKLFVLTGHQKDRLLPNCSGAALISEYHGICAPGTVIFVSGPGQGDIFGSLSYLSSGTSEIAGDEEGPV